MIYSAIELQHPIIIIDSNYPSLSIHDYARNHGYNVHVFAPNFGESETCNPLDFLIDSSDGQTAHFLATLINRYFRRLDNDNTFFGVASQQLTKALLMLAKDFGSCADILTVAAIVNSFNLIQRLKNADLNPCIKIAFGQLLSCADSQKTAAGIISSVMSMFSGLLVDNSVAWLIGKSTLPLAIEQRQMIILGITTDAPKAVSFLIWSIFELSLNRPLNSNLIVGCDELSFSHLSKHNYQQPIIALPKEFNQEKFIKYVTSKNDKTISFDYELTSRAKKIDLRLPLIKV